MAAIQEGEKYENEKEDLNSLRRLEIIRKTKTEAPQ
jgi:hypothetical protein